MPSATNKITFDNLTVNDGNGFDLMTSTFYPPETNSSACTFYWLHLSVGLYPYTAADVRIIGTTNNPNVLRGHNAWSGYDTSSRDELFCLAPVLNTMTLSSDGPLYSDAYFQTTFSGFQLDNVMGGTVVGFSVGRTSPVTAIGRITYDKVNIDTSGTWNGNEYIVPIDGIWVITVQACADSGGDMSVGIYTTAYDSFNTITFVYFFSTNNPGPDMTSKTVIFRMEAGTSIYSTLQDTPLYSDIRYQTAFLGFLYSPKELQRVCWCVSTDSVHIGLVEPVPFDIVYINEGNGWNAIINYYTVPLSGVYYIHLAAGIERNYGTNMQLVVNGEIKTNVYRSEAPHNGYDTRSKAVILRLQEGDKLHIRLPSGYRLFSDSNRITTFSGFRIYA